MGRWNGDRDCQPSELTVVCLLGWKLLTAYRAQNPRFGCQPLPRRGLLYENVPRPSDLDAIKASELGAQSLDGGVVNLALPRERRNRCGDETSKIEGLLWYGCHEGSPWCSHLALNLSPIRRAKELADFGF
jgi:hypothetical protein